MQFASKSFAVIVVLTSTVVVFAQLSVESTAIVNLRKVGFAESSYAIHHPKLGFACDLNELTKEEVPYSPQHAKLIDPSLLGTSGEYRFSAACVGSTEPHNMLRIQAVPAKQDSGMRTFCAEIRFYQGSEGPSTSEFPIHHSSKNAEACFKDGKLLE